MFSVIIILIAGYKIIALIADERRTVCGLLPHNLNNLQLSGGDNLEIIFPYQTRREGGGGGVKGHASKLARM